MPRDLHCVSILTTTKDPIHVLVTGATGEIGYALVPMIASGLMFGSDQPVILHMLDTLTNDLQLDALKMELKVSAFPLLADVIATTDIIEACTYKNKEGKDEGCIEYAIVLRGFIGRKDMDEKAVMSRNFEVYKELGSALDLCPNCKILVVGNPENTNASTNVMFLKECTSSIPVENITSLTRLDHNRALVQISEKLKAPLGDVQKVVIWGNYTSTQYPDINYATIKKTSTCYCIHTESFIRDQFSHDEWLKLRNEVVDAIHKHDPANKGALSIAKAACDHIRDWAHGTPKGTWVSMGVLSDSSSYKNVPDKLIYSFPVTCQKGKWEIVKGIEIDQYSREKIELTTTELNQEKALAAKVFKEKGWNSNFFFK